MLLGRHDSRTANILLCEHFGFPKNKATIKPRRVRAILRKFYGGPFWPGVEVPSEVIELRVRRSNRRERSESCAIGASERKKATRFHVSIRCMFRVVATLTPILFAGNATGPVARALYYLQPFVGQTPQDQLFAGNATLWIPVNYFRYYSMTPIL